MGDGRLTVEELEDRLAAAYQSRTRPELDRLAPRCQVINLVGSSDLDLSAVELAAERVELNVLSLIGDSRITVHSGLNVEVSRIAVLGGHHVDLGSAPTDPGGPVLHVRFISIMGGGKLRRPGAPNAEVSPGRRRRRRRRLGRGRH